MTVETFAFLLVNIIWIVLGVSYVCWLVAGDAEK